MKNLTTQNLVLKIGKALKEFGEHQFDDKGPGEVMHVNAIVKELREMSAAQAAEIIRTLSVRQEHEGRCKTLASYLVLCLDDWDALFEEPGIEELYD